MKISKELIEFENKITGYFLQCEQDGLYPDEAGMILHLGISQETYDKYRDDEDGKYTGFARCIDEARLRRESRIVREIYSSDSKSGKLFLARLPGNRGLNGRQRVETKKQSVEVVISGGASGYFE